MAAGMDVRKGLLAVADRLEGFAARLPEPLRRPILAEFRPLKELFLVRRAPRLLLVGANADETARLLGWLVGGERAVQAWEEVPGWLWLPGAGEGEPGIGLLPVGLDQPSLVREALAQARPDAVLIMSSDKLLSESVGSVAGFLTEKDPEASLVPGGHVIMTGHQSSKLHGEWILRAQSGLRGVVGKDLFSPYFRAARK